MKASELIALGLPKETLGKFRPRTAPAPWRSWGEGLEEGSVRQMEAAARLPVAVRGALMPDAHQGYGLPIGGVLATENAVIPYAVGVDIACRMKLTLLDMEGPETAFAPGPLHDRLVAALTEETRFGMGAEFRGALVREHPVLDDPAWREMDVTRKLRDRAVQQLGTSGSGNHFVEYGSVTVHSEEIAAELGLPHPGAFVALLSHSGSRGPGARVAAHFSGVAERRHPELPKELRHLAWLDLDREEGQEYWNAMELMGRFASANHDRIHHHIGQALGAPALLTVENHLQLRLARGARRPAARRPPERGDPGRHRGARPHPRHHGGRRLLSPRQGGARIAPLRLPRRRAPGAG